MDENKMMLIGSEQGNVMCTMDMTTQGVPERVFNALSAPTGKLSSLIGKSLKIEDVYAENVEGVNDETGEIENYTMIVIFTPDGDAYMCSSTGVKNALRRAFALFGSPTWRGGLEFEVLQVETPKGRTFTLRRCGF